MNIEEAESVKHLAKPLVEALEKVTERECGECKGCGRVKNIFLPGEIGCITCKGTGKLRWKWEPEVGDFILRNNKVYILFPVVFEEDLGFDANYKVYTNEPCFTLLDEVDDYIPILPWETIERVLEGVLDARFEFSRGTDIKWVLSVELHQDRFLKNGYYRTIVSSGKDRTRAVYEATIKLGEEVGNE